MNAIITGAGGQDGFYLSQLLEHQNLRVTGVWRKDDVGDFGVIRELVKTYKPDYIFHLAANSTTSHSALFENHRTIATGTLNILESVKTFSPTTKVFICGSGLQFGKSEKPIKESDEFEARDAYSISRIESVYAARYFRQLGLRVYVGYLFNHESPMRTERHISKKISEAAKRIAKGSDEMVELGDISVVKEWGFAGDIVRGIWELVNQDRAFEANVSTGEGHSIEEWLDQCFSLIKKSWQDRVVIRKEFVSEYSKLVSDPAVIHSLGWHPVTSFEQLAKMMIE